MKKYSYLLKVALFSILSLTISQIGMAGDTKNTPEDVKTIAVLWPALSSIVLSLDHGPDRLVAIPPQIKKSFKKGIMFDIYPGLKKVASKKVINNKRQANIEELLKLDPDVVFQDAHKKKSIKALKAAGLTVVSMKPKKKGLEKALLMQIGNVLGKQQEAKEIIKWIDSVQERVNSKVLTRDGKDKPTVVYLWHKNKLVGRAHNINIVLSTAGAKNGVKKDKHAIGFDAEQLLKINPDIIFIHHIGSKKTPDDFYNDPIYADMKAIKERRVYKVPRGAAAGWDGPSQERGFAYEWFARVVNGNDFLDGSMRASIKEIFPKLYGKNVTDKQINNMLYVGKNKGSADYDNIAK